MKRIKLLSLLLVAALFVQNADAALTYLPYSSYYQGRSYFDYSGTTGIVGRVEFAVYDTWGPSGNEWANATGFDVPGGDDQYIYAYQIFNDAGSIAIGSFTMWREDGGGLIVNNMGEANPDDMDPPPLEHDFVKPTGRGSDGVYAWWEFEGGILVAGEDSWFLIFSSSHPWTLGNYKMDPDPANHVPFPNPEPCTLVLLGLGSAILFAKRKNSVARMAHAVKSRRVRSHN